MPRKNLAQSGVTGDPFRGLPAGRILPVRIGGGHRHGEVPLSRLRGLLRRHLENQPRASPSVLGCATSGRRLGRTRRGGCSTASSGRIFAPPIFRTKASIRISSGRDRRATTHTQVSQTFVGPISRCARMASWVNRLVGVDGNDFAPRGGYLLVAPTVSG